MLIGSADLMPRNLNNRVEVLFPITNIRLVKRIKKEVLEIYLKNGIRAWELQPDGEYKWLTEDPESAFDVQEHFILKAENPKI